MIRKTTFATTEYRHLLTAFIIFSSFLKLKRAYSKQRRGLASPFFFFFAHAEILFYFSNCMQTRLPSLCVSLCLHHIPASSTSLTASPPMSEPSGVDLIGCRSEPGQGSVARLPSDNWLEQATVGRSVIQGLSCNLVHLQTIVWTPERLSGP